MENFANIITLNQTGKTIVDSKVNRLPDPNIRIRKSILGPVPSHFQTVLHKKVNKNQNSQSLLSINIIDNWLRQTVVTLFCFSISKIGEQ